MSTNPKTNKKIVIRPPYPLYKKFPSSFERATYKCYNALENRLWPIRPSLFTASVAAVGAYQVKFPASSLAQLVPTFQNQYAQVVKICTISLAAVYLPIFLYRQFLSRFYFSYRNYLFEKKPSLTTKFWAFLRKILSFSPPLLKSCDNLLPSPSCPDLDDTVRKYLGSVKNTLTAEEFALVKEQAKMFLAGEGRTLHNYARIYSLFTDNYVTPFWEKYAYLYGRYPLLINSSVAHTSLMKDIPATLAVRSAHVTYIETMSQLAVDRQDYKPLGDGLLCARHYDKLYAVTRVPDQQVDFLKNYGISKHIAAFHKGNLYKIQICDDRNNIYSLDQLTKIFSELFNRDTPEADGIVSKVAALTCDKRDQWAKNRSKFFVNNEINKRALEVIESAIFFFIYDDNDSYDYNPENPELYSGFLRNMLTGNGANRWADKSLNYIVTKSTRCGGTTEHSIADGAEFDHIMENFVYMDSVVLNYPPIEEQKKIEIVTDEDRKTLKFAEQLHISVNEEMTTEIERCYNAHQQSANDVDLAATIFRDFGKGLIKKCKVSPDAFIQMAIQLANFRDQGKFSLTYEPASARLYKNSRTETLRSVSDESCKFVRAMVNATVTKEEKISLLKKAAERHGIRNKECMAGKGVDRHLFVLYVLSKGVGISSSFLDHYISQQWILSTSHVPNCTQQCDEDTNPDLTWMGACFGAVAKEGYGICYRFGGNHSILAHITSYHSSEKTNSKRFQAHFVTALKEMAGLFEVSP